MTRPIDEYVVISSRDGKDFEAKVQAKLGEGFVILGDPLIYKEEGQYFAENGEYEVVFHQVMAKYK